jgi:hypothetical protein
MVVLLVFLFASSAVAIASKAVAAHIAGFRGLDIMNIAITTNARGGAGIVLASVTYDAGLINAAFYSTLVITAVLTSQVCGAWLRYVLVKSLPLLSSNPEETGTDTTARVAATNFRRACPAPSTRGMDHLRRRVTENHLLRSMGQGVAPRASGQ